MGSLHDIHLTPFSVSINLYMYNTQCRIRKQSRCLNSNRWMIHEFACGIKETVQTSQPN